MRVKFHKLRVGDMVGDYTTLFTTYPRLDIEEPHNLCGQFTLDGGGADNIVELMLRQRLGDAAPPVVNDCVYVAQLDKVAGTARLIAHHDRTTFVAVSVMIARNP
jgi:hypothetical protein